MSGWSWVVLIGSILVMAIPLWICLWKWLDNYRLDREDPPKPGVHTFECPVREGGRCAICDRSMLTFNEKKQPRVHIAEDVGERTYVDGERSYLGVRARILEQQAMREWDKVHEAKEVARRHKLYRDINRPEVV